MSSPLSRRKGLRHGTTKTKTLLSNINAYRKCLSTLEEAMLKIIEEKDRLSYPEERVSSIHMLSLNNLNANGHDTYNCYFLGNCLRYRVLT